MDGLIRHSIGGGPDHVRLLDGKRPISEPMGNKYDFHLDTGSASVEGGKDTTNSINSGHTSGHFYPVSDGNVTSPIIECHGTCVYVLRGLSNDVTSAPSN